MTTRNNYVRAAEGQPDIEVTLFYDTYRARHEWLDNFERLADGVVYYIDNGNVPGSDSVGFRISGTRDSFERYYSEQGYTPEELKEWTMQELQDGVINDLGPVVANYEDLNKYDLENTGLQFVPDKELVRVSVRGYSQGDYAEVIYCPEDLREAWGNAPDQSDLIETFTHLFYHAPIYGVITVNGDEYQYELDSYEFKRKEWLEHVADKAAVPFETLDAICPNEPDYQ